MANYTDKLENLRRLPLTLDLEFIKSYSYGERPTKEVFFRLLERLASISDVKPSATGIEDEGESLFVTDDEFLFATLCSNAREWMDAKVLNDICSTVYKATAEGTPDAIKAANASIADQFRVLMSGGWLTLETGNSNLRIACERNIIIYLIQKTDGASIEEELAAAQYTSLPFADYIYHKNRNSEFIDRLMQFHKAVDALNTNQSSTEELINYYSPALVMAVNKLHLGLDEKDVFKKETLNSYLLNITLLLQETQSFKSQIKDLKPQEIKERKEAIEKKALALKGEMKEITKLFDGVNELRPWLLALGAGLVLVAVVGVILVGICPPAIPAMAAAMIGLGVVFSSLSTAVFAGWQSLPGEHVDVITAAKIIIDMDNLLTPEEKNLINEAISNVKDEKEEDKEEPGEGATSQY